MIATIIAVVFDIHIHNKNIVSSVVAVLAVIIKTDKCKSCLIRTLHKFFGRYTEIFMAISNLILILSMEIFLCRHTYVQNMQPVVLFKGDKHT